MSRRRPLLLETLEDRILCDAAPDVTLQVPAAAKIGDAVQIVASFDNTSATDTGFGPYIDLVIDKTGADGALAALDDGLSFVNATYLGQPVTSTVLTFNASGQVTHPYAVDAAGNPLVINAPAGYGEGDQLIVMQLPFGSFSPTQPLASVTVNLQMSNLADANAPLNIAARGGFQFGNDPLENPATDPSLVDPSYATATVTPTLMTLTKVYLGPEDETATGPNFLRQYRIEVDVADGQTLTNLQIQDQLPAGMQFVSVNAVTGGAVVGSSNPSTTTPGGTVSRTLNSVTGVAGGPDATVTFTYFVPRIDSGSAVIINATTGDDVTLLNNASAAGNWTPLDGRDPLTAVSVNPAGPEHTLTAKSIATQKSVTIVTDTGAVGATPGDTLEYVIQVQVSDYFAFQNLVLTDLFSDGQRFDAGFTPTLSWDEHGTFGTAGWNAANFTVALNADNNPLTPATDGSTTVTFRLSNEMVTRGQDGKLIGGGIPNGGTGLTPLPNNPALPFAATTATIRFRTVIQDTFSDSYPSGNPSLNPRDILTNAVTVNGDLLAVNDVTTPTGQSEADTSAASVAIVNTIVSKTIYAVNGSTNLAPVTGPSGQILIAPGDTVTYRLQFTVPTGDIENLSFADYLPSPIFAATQVIGFVDTIDGTVPAAGQAKYGPNDTMRTLLPGAATVSTNATNNLVTFTVGTANDPANTSRVVDILFTVTASNQPFADGLFLTNQVQASENNTQQPAVAAVSDAIIQVQLQEPDVTISKGVVGFRATGLTLGGIVFTAPTVASSFTGTVDSAADAAAIGANNLTGNQVDAGDIVRYAVVLQNIGRNDAFDVSASDQVISGYDIPASLAAMNFTVRRGDGTLLTVGTDYTASITVGGAISLTLTDSYTSGNVGAETDSGSLSRGFNANSGAAVTNGSNTVVVTYDLTLATAAQARSTIVNTATLTNYAGTAGGTDFTTVNPTETASVNLANVVVAKTLTGTEITGTNNSNTQAVIGELATYTLTLTVPEGTAPGATLLDTLDAGLAFVDIQSVSLSAGVTTGNAIGTGTNPANVTVSPTGQTLTFNFGAITNANAVNGTPETITIVYRAVVLNTNTLPASPGNQAGTLLNNSAVFSAQFTNQPGGSAQGYSLAAVSAGNLTVVEPVVTTAKTASIASGDAGDAVTYTITLRNNAVNSPDAFEVTFADNVPASINVSGFTVSDTAALVSAANFDLTGNVLTTLTPFDLASSAARIITITISGTLASSVGLGTSIVNTGDARWTSIDGAPGVRSVHNASAVERTGTGGFGTDAAVLNNYAAAPANTITVTGTPVKSLVTTSETHTTGNNLAVGEIARYRLLIIVPEGTTSNLNLRDNLPPGLTFLDDGTATAVLVADTATNITSTLFSGAGTSVAGDNTTIAGIAPTVALGDALVSSLEGSDNDTYAHGTDVFFKFGNIVNNENDADAEYLVVEFNAIVSNDNAASNDAGDTRTNNFVIRVNAADQGTSNSIVSTVLEPQLTFDKTANRTLTDSADTITYTITLTNSAGATSTTAFDLALTDLLPALTTLNLASINVVLAGGASGMTDTSAGNNLALALSTLPAGGSVTVTYTATVSNAALPGNVLINSALVTATSLPGAGTVGGTNTTGSSAGAAGGADGERTGSGVAPNDLRATDTVTVTMSASTVAGVTYLDFDNDGVLDAGETRLANTTVVLTGTDHLGNAVALTTTTNGSGQYTFSGLRPSDGTGYIVTETQPAVLFDGKNTVGTAGGTTVNNPLSDVIDTIVLPLRTNTNGQNYNFGELQPASVAGNVYVDADNDGVFDGGETPINGVSLTLSGIDDLGSIVNLTTSTVGGAYSFTGLRPSGAGGYSVAESQPAGFLDGRDTAGAVGGGTAGSDVVSNITLTSGLDSVSNNFGELRPASIAGTVFNDTNNDGLINGADTGLSGVSVTLSGTDDRGATVNSTILTNGTGGYSFTTLRPGNYVLTESQPATHLDGRDALGTQGGTPGNDTITAIALTEGTNGTGNNFGEVLAAALSGSVYLDANNDGLFQGGESGIGSVTVTLTGINDLGAAVNVTTTTNAGGAYTFATLRPSNATGYTITETPPAGYGDGTDAIGTQGGTTGNDVLSGIVLGAGVSGTGNNFGERIVADLSVTKTDGSATYIPGTAITYTVVVGNAGPSFVNGAVVADAIPATIIGATWTATYAGVGSAGAAGGSGDINTAINLASGGTATFTISGMVLSTATGNLVNTATVTAPVGVNDLTPGNNTATDTDTQNSVADLSITKTDGSATYIPGTAISYTVVVSNTGPSFVSGAVVADTIPANISGATWTAVYAGAGSAGAAGGSGNINTAIDLASGGSATFTISGTVLATATGNLVNTATVAAPAGVTDPTPGNNSATDTDTANPVADLAITKTDGVTSVVPGTANTYTIVVSNIGPGFVTGATVADTLPATLTGVNWTAVYAGAGSSGAAGGSGNISTTINLAVGGTATFTVTGTVASTATGTLVNTATVTPPVGVTDPTPGNNSATDTDTLTPVADLSVTKTDGSATYISGTAITYTVVVSNGGPSFVNGAVVADAIPAEISGATWTAVYAGVGSAGAAGGSGDINTAINLASGGSATFTITGTVLLTTTGNLVNTATVTPPATVTDPTPGNNSATDTDVRDLTSLAGFVFSDANNDGLVQPGESGIAGATVTLTGTDNLGGAVNLIVTTLADGSYSFINLRASNAAGYTITETQPGGFLDGTDIIGTPGGVAGNDVFSTIVLVQGVSGTDNNFGELAPSSLAGLVYNDTNNDGLAQFGESGIAGVTVTLTGANDQGAIAPITATTLADGSYTFGNLRPGTYAVTETQPGAFLDGRDTVGTPGGTTGADAFTGILLATGTNGTANNFGELRPATLSGTVFQDDSNDGGQQPGEPGVANVTVALTGTDDLGNPVNVTVTTLPDGSYSFANLRPGTYAITETQPAGLLDGRDALGTAGGTLANDAVSAITLVEGQTGSGYTFGEIVASSIAGTIFSDLDNNGVIDPGDSGIGGAAVTLTGTDDLGNAVALSTGSALDGTYGFGNLRPGTYTITETQPAGFLDGQNAAGTTGGTTVNNPLSDVISAITLPGNTAAVNYLFGELVPASLSGTVFHDLDNDGVNDPTDLPIVGATVTLTGTDDLGNAVNTGTTTAADGTYTFANLRPGTYTQTETQPAGYLDGIDTAGTAGGTPANDTFSAIALAVGQTGGGYLFGERTSPDLVVTKTDGISIALPGDRLTYTITVANVSLQQADSVTVTDQFPSALQFLGASNGGTFDPATGVITWNVGAIAGSNAQTVTLTVSARVPAIIPASLRSVTNSVTAADISGLDATPANNTASDTDGIPSTADLYVLKTDRLERANVGDRTSYTITGGNAGGRVAEGVVITDTLPDGLRFVSASNGGQLVNGRVVWNLGDLPAGATFQLTVRVVVEIAASGRSLVNTVEITDRFGSFEDTTPSNNSATDTTQVVTFFAFDAFHNFARDRDEPLLPGLSSPDVTRDALLPLAPIYSGEADPGSTLVVALYNAKGERIGSQTVMVDAGGNWLVSFPSTTVRDTPQSVQITQLSAAYSLGDSFGHNLRTYFSPALNPGHFFESVINAGLDARPAPLLEGLGLENPLQLGSVKYGGELLSTQSTASGY